MEEVIKEKICDKSEDPQKIKSKTIETRKQTYEDKHLHSALIRESNECRDDKDSWLWLKRGYLKKETEGFDTGSTRPGNKNKVDQETYRQNGYLS